jgi:hypothetical protein
LRSAVPFDVGTNDVAGGQSRRTLRLDNVYDNQRTHIGQVNGAAIGQRQAEVIGQTVAFPTRQLLLRGCEIGEQAQFVGARLDVGDGIHSELLGHRAIPMRELALVGSGATGHPVVVAATEQDIVPEPPISVSLPRISPGLKLAASLKPR